MLALLRDAVGDAVSVDAAVLDDARSDRSGRISSAPPLAVVTARSVDDVKATLRIANTHGVSVVPRGAGTGLAGGAIADRGEIVLSTLAMNRILEVSVDDELAVVEPGIINADLNRELAESGLWWAPDPASKEISTVGGNIATNAGGLLCVKYGVTREAVLGLRVVLADGRELTVGHRTVKGVTGLDLTALMIGSEGTLGVIVEATLRLRPRPIGTVATIAAWFYSIEDAARAAVLITASRVRPAVLELVDARALAYINSYLGLEPGERGVHVLVQTDGAGAEAEADAALAVIRTLGGVAESSTDPAEAERLLAIRRSFHPAMAARGSVLIEDVAVPRSKLPAMFEAIAEIERRLAVEIPTVAHAGDGNLHPNFVYDGDVVPELIWQAADEVFQACLRLGGTLTGEHGVGLLKQRWLREELGDDQTAILHGIKRVFDPNGILNPGKAF